MESSESSGVNIKNYEYIPFSSVKIPGNGNVGTVAGAKAVTFSNDHDFAFAYGVWFIKGGYTNQSNRNPSGWVLLKSGQAIAIPGENHNEIFRMTFNDDKHTITFTYRGWFAGGTFYYACIGV